MDSLSALVLSLPTRSSTVRMRVWRALKGTGCGVLRDGVYVLPKDASAHSVFPEVESQVRSAGGFAMTVDIGFRGASQQAHVRKLFDRADQYGELVGRINALKATLERVGKDKAEATLQRLEREFAALEEIDFFPGEAQSQAQAALDALRLECRQLYSRGEPNAKAGTTRRADSRKFKGRTWATRKDLWIDRLACAWLIKRFIDKDARFAWIESPRACPKGAVGFDFDGATFTHVGSRVTFETLLASFGLESDPALAAIGAAVHFLDAGGIPVPDARGLETLLRGVVQKARNDDERVSKANGVFDHLYAAYSSS